MVFVCHIENYTFIRRTHLLISANVICVNVRAYNLNSYFVFRSNVCHAVLCAQSKAGILSFNLHRIPFASNFSRCQPYPLSSRNL